MKLLLRKTYDLLVTSTFRVYWKVFRKPCSLLSKLKSQKTRRRKRKNSAKSLKKKLKLNKMRSRQHSRFMRKLKNFRELTQQIVSRNHHLLNQTYK